MSASAATSTIRVRNRLFATTAVPALVVAMGSVAYAGSNLPTGGQVTGGSVTINTPSATQMQITSTTARSAISWQDFSIGAGNSVNITQPNGGTQLESVRGTNVSQIFGSLTSNGSIVIANPNGIWFGPNAQVDVAGLAAVAANPSAADVTNFMNHGSLNLSQAGNANAAIINQGNITITNAGLAAFVAPGVRNDGVIAARLGTVQLSSGTTATLDFYGDGLISIAVSGQTLAQAIDPSTGKPVSAAAGNTGTINADGGTVLISANTAANVVNDAINVSGVVQAQSVSQQNGQIVLDGGSNGNVQVAGTLDASGYAAGQTGGHIQVTGQTVNVASNAVLDASGDQGGGSIYVGGGVHGQGTADVATTTTVAKGAVIKVNAVTNGNGGTIAVWSQQNTSFDGSIQAQGGAQSGNGGFVETSGANLTLGGDASVNTLAANGLTGSWLLDPSNVTIAPTGGTETGAQVVSALNSSSFTISASSGITVSDTIDSSAQTNSDTLELKAPKLTLDDPITLASTQTLTGTATKVNVNSGGLIQNGIDAAASGATIDVGAGTFQEQLFVDKNLTLIGDGAGNTIIDAPATMATSFNTWVTFDGMENVVAVIGVTKKATIENLTVDGLSSGDAYAQFVGIGAFNAGLTVSGVHVTDIQNTTCVGCQTGIGIGVFNEDNTARNVTLTGNTIDHFQKDGISLQGGSLTVDVENNTVTGEGSTTNIGQNGIELLGFAGNPNITPAVSVTGTVGGTIGGNVVSGIGFESNSDYATGIYVLGTNGVTASNNTITGTTGTNPTDSGYGFSILGSKNVALSGNQISYLSRGVSVGDGVDGSFFPNNGKNITVSGGSIENTGTGVYFDPTYATASGASTFGVTGVDFANNTIHFQGTSAQVPNVLANNTFDGTATDLINLPDTIYGSIQAAVDAETISGATIDLLGTFTQQVLIDSGLNLTLVGTGGSNSDTTISAPDTLATSFTTEVTFDGVEPVDAVVAATGGGTVTVENLTVDGRGLGGNDQFVGIGAYNTNLNVSGVHVTNIENTPLSGVQSGIGIGVFNEDNNGRNVSLTGNTVDNFQKDGISLQGGSLTVDVENNTVTGAGATSAIGQNGIELLGFASSTYLNSTGVTGTIGGTIGGNVVSNIGFIPNTDYATPIYILGATGVTVSSNTVTGTGGDVSAYGISILGSSNIIVENNVLSDLARGVSVGDEIDGSFFSNNTSIAISGGSIENSAIGVSVDPTYASYVTVSGVTFANNTIHYQGSGTGVPTAASVLASNTFDGAATDSTNFPDTIYGSIQAAVNADAANSGATIDLIGNFTGQVSIGSSLSLVGTGGSNSDTTIYAPASLGTSFTTWVTFDGNEAVAAVIGVTGGANVTIQNLTVDGLSSGDNYAQFVGIGANNASLTVSGVHVTNIRNNPAGTGVGDQTGIGIGVFNEDNTARSVSLTDNTVDNFQKDGISLQGGSLTVDVENNTVTGSGSTDANHAAQNGIELLGFAGNSYITPAVSVTGTVGGTIGGNVVSNMGFASNSDYATGIYVLTADHVNVEGNTVTGTGGSVSAFGISILGSSNVTVQGNTLSDLARGVSVGDDIDGSFFPTTDSSVIVTDNTIENNAVGIEVAAGSTGTQIGGGSSIGSTVGNLITGNTTAGILVASDAGTGTVVHWNSVAGNTIALENDSSNFVDATGNWWGTTNPTTADGEIASGGASTGDTYVDFNAMLASGTNQFISGPGFDAFPSVIVHNLGASDGSTGRIQEGIDLAGPAGNLTSGGSDGTVTVSAGNYSTENTSVDVSLGDLVFASGSTTIGSLNSVRADQTEFDGSLNVTGSLTVGSAYFNGGNVTTAGDQTYSGGISLGADALIEAGGNINFDGITFDGSGDNFAALAQGNINLNGALQLIGTAGDLSLVAGWDGLTQPAGESAADIDALLAHTTTAGATYGQNGGSVTIGGSNGYGYVGSVNGTTTVAGYDVVVQGGTGSNDHAQIGSGYGFAPSGNIDVLAVHDVEVLGGSGDGAYAQIGNGGLSAGDCCGSYAFGGDINVTAGNSVIVTGGHNDNAYAQIGNGGGYAFESNRGLSTISVSGNISVTATSGNVSLGGGNHLGTYAQIGHGGFNFASGASSTGGATMSGDITVSAGGTTGVSLSGGSSFGAYAQIGHGGQGAFQNATIGSSGGSLSVGGNISVTATNGNVSLYGGTERIPYAQIGHGGQSFAERARITDNATIDGDIVVNANGNVSVTGGNGTDDYAQIGHGGNSAFYSATVSSGSLSIGDTSANITVIATSGNVSLGAGIGNAGIYAQIGHGGYQFAYGANVASAAIDGDITVSAGGSTGVSVSGGGGTGAYAQIGHGGQSAFQSATISSGSLSIGASSANISVVASDGDVSLFGGYPSSPYAQIGHGGQSFAEGAWIADNATIDGDITVNAAGNVSVTGGTGFDDYAQIGHGGDSAFEGATITGSSGSLSIGNTSASISVIASAGSVYLSGGSFEGSYAQIGHGGQDFASSISAPSATIDGDITVSAGGSGGVSMFGDAGGGSYAQIGHGGSYAFGGASLDNLAIGDTSANIAVTSNGNTYVFAGDGWAQIGNGGARFASDSYGFSHDAINSVLLAGAIDVTSQNGGVTVLGGYRDGAYAQIGHGGGDAFAYSDIGTLNVGNGQTITVNGYNYVEVAGGESSFAYAQIGNGGAEFASFSTLGTATVGGDVSVASSNGYVFVEGGGASLDFPYDFGNSYAQIGNGGGFAFVGAGMTGALSVGGNITVTAGNGDVAVRGGYGFSDYAQVGNGGASFGSFAPFFFFGPTAATSLGDVTLSGDVTVNANGPDGGVFVGSNGNGPDFGYLFSYSQIGNGGSIAFLGTELNSLSVGGNVTVATTGNVNVSGGSDTTGGPSLGEYAQIGNGGYAFASFGLLGAPPAFSGTVDVTAGGTLSATWGSNDTNYAVIGDGDPWTNGVLAGTVNVTSVGDQTYTSYGPGDELILASGTYSTNGGTLNFWDSNDALTTVFLSGSITIDNSFTTWGPVTFGDGAAPNMTFNLSGQDTTFTGQVGSLASPVGNMSITGGNNFTIDNGVEVYVTNFSDANMSGILNFGSTLNVAHTATLSGTIVGDLVCDTGGLSCVVVGGPGTFNGINIAFDFGDQTLHLFNIEYALSNPGQSLGGGGVNPQAGCSDAEKQANGGSCPAGSGDATTFGNGFLNGGGKL